MTAGTVRTTETAGAMEGDPGDGDAVSRRKVFAMCSLGLLGAAGLAACGSGSSGDSSATTSTAPDVAASAGSDGATAAATSAGSATGGPAATGKVISKLSAVPVGSAVGLNVDGNAIIVSRPTEKTAVVLSAVCPHAGGIVAPVDKVLRCPLHGSTFVEATGANIDGPAAGQPLKVLTSSVQDGNVLLG